MSNDLEQIRKQFNSDKRVDEMLASYGVDASKKSVEIDHFEPNREQLIYDTCIELAGSNPGKVLDVGCGIGGLVAKLLARSIDTYGIDYAERMVSLAHEYLTKRKFDPSRVTQGDIFTYQPPHQFSQIIANGVIWYYEDKVPFLKKLNQLLQPGGKVLIIHRNDLFNLTALNAGTLDFFARNLLGHFDSGAREQTIDRLSAEVGGLRQEIIKHSSSALSKTYENPLSVHALYESTGFSVSRIRYTYIHPNPPRLKNQHPVELYAELQQKYADAWQGMFLGSQFFVIATKTT